MTDEKKDELKDSLEDAQRRLSDYRIQLHKSKPLHGISTDDLRKALKVDSNREAISFATKVADQRSRD
jgi:hypothetical protein